MCSFVKDKININCALVLLIHERSYLGGIYLFKANKETPKHCVKSVQSQQCLYRWYWSYFTHYSVISIIDFEQVNAGWVQFVFVTWRKFIPFLLSKIIFEVLNFEKTVELKEFGLFRVDQQNFRGFHIDLSKFKWKFRKWIIQVWIAATKKRT